MKLSKEQISTIHVRMPFSASQEIVLLDVGGKKEIPEGEYNRNIYLIDKNYSVIWQIDAPTSPHGRDSFVALQYIDGMLRADRFFGRVYEVDENSGVAKEVGWHK